MTQKKIYIYDDDNSNHYQSKFKANQELIKEVTKKRNIRIQKKSEYNIFSDSNSNVQMKRILYIYTTHIGFNGVSFNSIHN